MTPELDTLIGWHAATTWFMTGLIWFVQIVHYPLMAGVGRERWIEYENLHRQRTTVVVLPAMLIEAASGFLILILLHGAEASRAGQLLTSVWLSTALLVATWLSTALVQVPLHHTLSRAFDPVLLRRLVMTNWFRTALWTIRAILVHGWISPR